MIVSRKNFTAIALVVYPVGMTEIKNCFANNLGNVRRSLKLLLYE